MIKITILANTTSGNATMRVDTETPNMNGMELQHLKDGAVKELTRIITELDGKLSKGDSGGLGN